MLYNIFKSVYTNVGKSENRYIQILKGFINISEFLSGKNYVSTSFSELHLRYIFIETI